MSKYPKITQKDLVDATPTKKVLKTIGNTYGRLYVTSVAGKRVVSSTFYVNCDCSCGKKIIANVEHLIRGNWSSCGCIKKTNPSRKKHGYAPLKGKRDKIYVTWQGIMKRCYNKNNNRYYMYGNAGICVCLGWRGENGFINFKNDMLPITDKTIDRIDTTKHYSCGKCEECLKNGWEFNCRWADYKTQSNNRGDFNNWIVLDGKKMTYREASRYLGFNEKTLQSRIKSLGWSVEKAISTPIKKNKNYE